MSPPGRVGVDASSTALLSQGTPSNRLSPESLQLSTRVCAMAEMYSTQDHFLNTLIETKKHCNIFLVNGIRLTGTLVGHDRFVLFLLGPGQSQQMVYKHAVSPSSGSC